MGEGREARAAFYLLAGGRVCLGLVKWSWAASKASLTRAVALGTSLGLPAKVLCAILEPAPK